MEQTFRCVSRLLLVELVCFDHLDAQGLQLTESSRTLQNRPEFLVSYFNNLENNAAMKLLAIFATTAILVASCLPGRAEAQQIPQGPFDSVQDLISSWQHIQSRVGISVDGVNVYYQMGFGPGVIGRYFVCPSDAKIRTECPPTGPFSSTHAIIRYAESTHHKVSIYVDGIFLYSQQGFGPAGFLNYYYCADRRGYMTDCSL